MTLRGILLFSTVLLVGTVGRLDATAEITLDSYEITDPSDPADIVYNRVQDTTITFTVTVSASAATGTVNGIKVYFVDTDDTKIPGTEQVAGGDAPTSANPLPITDTDGPTPITGNTVNLKFASAADCTAATKLCVLIEGTEVKTDGAEKCLPVGTDPNEAGDTNCAELKIDANSLTITSPEVSEILYTRTDPTEIVFTMTVSPTEVANDGQVAAVNVYFTDGDTKTSNGVPAPLPDGTPVQVDSAATSLGDVSASITMDGDCAHYTDLCAEILDGIIVWDFQCINIGSEDGQAGDKDCSVLTIDDGSFKITEPSPSEITYTNTKDTTITFEMTISPATGLTGQVETVNVFFSDKDETQTVPVPGAFDDGPLAVDDANTRLGDVVATVILDENCEAYTHLCVQILDGTVVEDEACLETGSEDDEAGEVECEAIDLASGLLTIISPDDAISCADKPTVKFDLHVCDVGGDGGTITDVKFYYMDTDKYDAASSKRSPEHSTKLTAEVDADGDHTFSDKEVELTDDDKCEDYSYLCAFIVVTDDTDNENDYSCIKLDLSEISTDNCQDSAAAGIGVGKYSILASVIFALASYLF